MFLIFKTNLRACFQNYRGPELWVYRCSLFVCMYQQCREKTKCSTTKIQIFIRHRITIPSCAVPPGGHRSTTSCAVGSWFTTLCAWRVSTVDFPLIIWAYTKSGKRVLVGNYQGWTRTLDFEWFCASLMSHRNISVNWGLVHESQARLKSLDNILKVFENPFLQSRLCEHDFDCGGVLCIVVQQSTQPQSIVQRGCPFPTSDRLETWLIPWSNDNDNCFYYFHQ